MVLPAELPPVARNPVHIVLDNIRSAFNVGSIFRTADAGAVEQLHLCGMTAFPPNLKLSKTALGATDYVPWTHRQRTEEALDWLKAAGIPCYAAEATDEALSYTAVAWPQPVAIVFGNEVTGVSPQILARCDGTVRIPMGGYKNTLNVATAFGIVLFEVLRQWKAF